MPPAWTWPPRGVRDYCGLEAVTGPELAEQWLWRDPEYRRLSPAAIRNTARGLLIDAAPRWCVERWGCLYIGHRTEHDGPPLLWSAAIQPSVVRVAVWSAGEGDPAA